MQVHAFRGMNLLAGAGAGVAEGDHGRNRKRSRSGSREYVVAHSILDETVKALITVDGFKFVQNWQKFPDVEYVVYDLNADPREAAPLRLDPDESAFAFSSSRKLIPYASPLHLADGHIDLGNRSESESQGRRRASAPLKHVLNFEEVVFPRKGIQRYLVSSSDIVMAKYKVSGCGKGGANGDYQASCSGSSCETHSNNPSVPIYLKVIKGCGERSDDECPVHLERIVMKGRRTWNFNYYPESMKPLEMWYRNVDSRNVNYPPELNWIVDHGKSPPCKPVGVPNTRFFTMGDTAERMSLVFQEPNRLEPVQPFMAKISSPGGAVCI